MRSCTLALMLALAAPAAFADTPAVPPSQPVAMNVPPANAKDVDSIESIVAALYDVISGPAGQARDWNRMRSLFIPGGRLMAVGGKSRDVVGIRLLTVNDYIASSGPLLLEKGFQERELARRVEQFGAIAHVFSTYEATIEKDGITMRGINSLQLMHDGKRWWIVSLMWQGEHGEVKLPAQYLATPRR